MRVSDLPAPVTAAKVDWLPANSWIGFSPSGTKSDASGKCQATVQRQFGKGYILERVTDSFEEPSAAFANDPGVIRDRRRHEEWKDGLIAIHRLQPSARPLPTIIGAKEYERLQDIWSSAGNRRRWSVAFPIVESYTIKGRPKAKAVFGPTIFKRLFGYQSAILRPLDDEARAAIAALEIEPAPASNAWIAIEDEFDAAERIPASLLTLTTITEDLLQALEGETEFRRQRLIKRAAWLGDKFVNERRKAGSLTCDDCSFNPFSQNDMDGISARACFDVHHKNPLKEGKRYTTTSDFALLCPTCHRVTHQRLSRDKKLASMIIGVKSHCR